MAKLSHPWDSQRIFGLKGTLDFYFWKGIPVVRKWPENTGRSLTPAARAQWGWFGFITQQWSNIDPPTAAAYAELARGTERVPRDYQLELYRNYSITLDSA